MAIETDEEVAHKVVLHVANEHASKGANRFEFQVDNGNAERHDECENDARNAKLMAEGVIISIAGISAKIEPKLSTTRTTADRQMSKNREKQRQRKRGHMQRRRNPK